MAVKYDILCWKNFSSIFPLLLFSFRLFSNIFHWFSYTVSFTEFMTDFLCQFCFFFYLRAKVLFYFISILAIICSMSWCFPLSKNNCHNKNKQQHEKKKETPFPKGLFLGLLLLSLFKLSNDRKVTTKLIFMLPWSCH